MKTMRFLYGAACAALASSLLGACTNDEDVMMNNGDASAKTPMTFTAGTAQTRTALGDDGKAVNWVVGDAIAVFDGTEKLEFTTQDAGATATFTGEARPAGSYTAFYPYANVTGISNETITFTLPAEQTAATGSFANGLAPSWAQTADGSNWLQFHNLCALVKFTVAGDMAGEGTFTLKGTNSESLAGSLTYTIGGGEASVSGNASAEVKLSGTFEAGKDYYFVVAPATLTDGLSLFYKGSEGSAYRRAGASSVTFGAGTVTDLGQLTLEKFEEAIINTVFIDAVLNSNVSSSLTGMTKNPDGTVTLTEANKNAMKSVWGSLIITNNSNLTDVSGIEYFTNVSWLQCTGNKNLTSLDVSGMSSLTMLWCNSNALTSLNVSGLTKLTELNCYDNANLASLDASGLSSLETLKCNNCALTSLNVNGLTKLTTLRCFANKLPSLDVSSLTNLQELRCNSNSLTSLNVSGLSSLTTLRCDGNEDLTSLDVSTLSSLTTLYCDACGIPQLDITSNTGLTDLRCGNQTSSGALFDMTLILTSAQKATWDSTWSKDLSYNTYVTVKEDDELQGGGATGYW